MGGDNQFVNLPIAESFVFVKCIYFFINYMNIVWINVLLILEPISPSPIFEIKYVMRWWDRGRNRYLGTVKISPFIVSASLFFISLTVE